MFAYLGSFTGLLLVVEAMYSARCLLSDHCRRDSYLLIASVAAGRVHGTTADG